MPGRFARTDDQGRWREFFVHSPFAWRQDDSTVVDRNGDSLVMQATFEIGGNQTKAILGSDVDHAALSDIVTVTKSHKREHRLEWDVCKLPTIAAISP